MVLLLHLILVNQKILMKENNLTRTFFFLTFSYLINIPFFLYADSIDIKMIANNCNGCHSYEKSKNNYIPSIRENSKKDFVIKMNQLKYKNDQSIMNRILKEINESDILKLADYYFSDNYGKE